VEGAEDVEKIVLVFGRKTNLKKRVMILLRMIQNWNIIASELL
jgi:hypothetical protein